MRAAEVFWGCRSPAPDHGDGGAVESRVTWLGEPLPTQDCQPGVPRARKRHRSAAAPVAAQQAQAQATQQRDMPTLAPLYEHFRQVAGRSTTSRRLAATCVATVPWGLTLIKQDSILVQETRRALGAGLCEPFRQCHKTVRVRDSCKLISSCPSCSASVRLARWRRAM